MAKSSNKKRAAIVGGGVAGLTCAYLLGRAGVSVDLFEAENELGGLARSFDLDGLKLERYHHFICLPDRHLVNLAAPEQCEKGGDRSLLALSKCLQVRCAHLHCS